MKASVWVAPVATVLVLLGSVPVAQATGAWVTSGRPAATASGSGSTQAINGQSTLRRVAQANGLDPAALARESGLPDGVDLDAPLKSLRDAVPGFEIQAVRDAVDRLT